MPPAPITDLPAPSGYTHPFNHARAAHPYQHHYPGHPNLLSQGLLPANPFHLPPNTFPFPHRPYLPGMVQHAQPNPGFPLYRPLQQLLIATLPHFSLHSSLSLEASTRATPLTISRSHPLQPLTLPTSSHRQNFNELCGIAYRMINPSMHARHACTMTWPR